MRRHITTYFAPNWVVIIFFLSLLEAIGFAIYFKADLVDPEIASIEPLYTGTQDTRILLHARWECDPNKPGVHRQQEHCPQYR